MTDVTIRGIEDDTYSKFAAEAKRRGMSIGELTTEAMNEVVTRGMLPSYRLEDLDELPVSRSDLESLDGPVVIQNVEVLEFADDVDWNVFKEHVQRIENVELIKTSKSLSKFQILTRARNVEDIQIRR